MGSHLDKELRKVQSLVSRMLALGTRAWVFPGNAAVDIIFQRRPLERSVLCISSFTFTMRGTQGLSGTLLS